MDKCYILLVKNADTTDPIGIELFGTGGGVGSGTILGIPATGLGNAPNNQSHQLSDAGWVTGTPSPGALNTGQSTLPVVKNEIEEFALYPNPVTNGQLFLSSRDRNDKQVEIYAWTGQQVFSEKVQSKETINISNLNRGIYMVRVYEEGKIATRKLIVN